MRRLHFVPLAMLLLFSVPHYAAAGPIYVGSQADPVGDTFFSGPGPDIVFAGIVVDDSWVTFTMQFAPGTWNPNTTKSTFNIDVDQNSATGELWNGLGIDFVVAQGYFGDTGTASLKQFPGNILVASAPVTFLTDGVEYSFARSFFGAEDGSLDFIAAVQTHWWPVSRRLSVTSRQTSNAVSGQHRPSPPCQNLPHSPCWLEDCHCCPPTDSVAADATNDDLRGECPAVGRDAGQRERRQHAHRGAGWSSGATKTPLDRTQRFFGETPVEKTVTDSSREASSADAAVGPPNPAGCVRQAKTIRARPKGQEK